VERNVDQASVEKRLKELLVKVIGESGGSHVRSADDLDPNSDFTAIGVNSVDLMEFILRIEKEFNLDVLSEMLPEELPSTLEGWAKLLHPRIARPTSSS
jgi:acyl carrier protein